MKASEKSSRRTHWILKIFLWINILDALLLIGAYVNTHISPNSIPYISFLGLGYPIILVIALLFIIFWLFFKRKYALISIITILIGFNHFRHFYAITLSQSELTNPVKVMSFNVHVFDVYNKQNRVENRNSIFSFLNDEQADILCFQEYYHHENSNEFVTKDSMVKLLDLKYIHERYTHEMSGQRYFGVATFSKYPIINKGEIPFANDNNNYCIYSDIKINDDTVRVFNAHIGSIRFQSDDYDFFGDPNGPISKSKETAGRRILGRIKQAFEKRAVQAEAVRRQIEASPFPVIVCGDLNDTPVSYSYRQFSANLNDAFVESGNGVGQTYIGKVPSNRIDYIFHDPTMRSSNFTTHQVNLSDHKPISCLIEMPQ
ncbi:endonuclease/exonuclease/phosphatase family protein [Paracrocinitomix mangrovi]|uniref:endonuclease/exonuclease/phosphatase family protein n=1 Tax=Paracrocinitomix mangrovi TaxID=2862509 RepID=UPI001C8E9985|nr:endonuclease/exonuclease/phosphatase family protein [Paracrocinitomix mangrovi]UKN01945.1 endonuclease/exonuclease/phosphatase family protein [Paracrocinitomix mangrovi]